MVKLAGCKRCVIEHPPAEQLEGAPDVSRNFSALDLVHFHDEDMGGDKPEATHAVYKCRRCKYQVRVVHVDGIPYWVRREWEKALKDQEEALEEIFQQAYAPEMLDQGKQWADEE